MYSVPCEGGGCSGGNGRLTLAFGAGGGGEWMAVWTTDLID